MKKLNFLIAGLIIAVFMLFASPFQTNVFADGGPNGNAYGYWNHFGNGNGNGNNNYLTNSSNNNGNIAYVEFSYIDGQWYVIIHFTNGDIQMNGIGHPPQ